MRPLSIRRVLLALGATVAAFAVGGIVVQPDPNWTGGLGAPSGVRAVHGHAPQSEGARWVQGDIMQLDPDYTGG